MGVRSWISKAIVAKNRGRSGNWLPVLLAFGAAGATAAPAIAALWGAWAGAGLVCLALGVALARSPELARWQAEGVDHRRSLVFALIGRGLGALPALVHALAWVCAGVALMGARIDATPRATPPPSGIVVVEGWIVDAYQTERGYHVRLRRDFGRAAAPYVSLSLTGANGALVRLGAAIRCRAILRPAGDPRAPGAFDEAQYAFFHGIGAQGFALGACVSGGYAPPLTFGAHLETALAALKGRIARASAAAIGGAEGAFAAGLLVGDRTLLSPADSDMFRASGLAHLLAVSGANMAIVAGGVMFLLRWTLAGLPWLAARIPAQKTAAFGALIACAIYLALCGPSPPTLRAFVMAAVALSAILLDRRAVSMRALAVSAAIVLALSPQSAIDPGFHMSFAASAALIALFELTAHAPAAIALPLSLPERVLRFVALSVGASLAAGIATAPASAFAFHRLASWGFFANVAAAPILSFVLAPVAFASALLAPFHLAGPSNALLHAILHAVLAIGRVAAALPQARIGVAAFSPAAFALMSLALYWFALWRGPLRLLAFALAAAAALLVYAAPLRAIIRADGAAGALTTGLSWAEKGAQRDAAAFAAALGRFTPPRPPGRPDSEADDPAHRPARPRAAGLAEWFAPGRDEVARPALFASAADKTAAFASSQGGWLVMNAGPDRLWARAPARGTDHQARARRKGASTANAGGAGSRPELTLAALCFARGPGKCARREVETLCAQPRPAPFVRLSTGPIAAWRVIKTASDALILCAEAAPRAPEIATVGLENDGRRIDQPRFAAATPFSAAPVLVISGGARFHLRLYEPPSGPWRARRSPLPPSLSEPSVPGPTLPGPTLPGPTLPGEEDAARDPPPDRR